MYLFLTLLIYGKKIILGKINKRVLIKILKIKFFFFLKGLNLYFFFNLIGQKIKNLINRYKVKKIKKYIFKHIKTIFFLILT